MNAASFGNQRIVQSALSLLLAWLCFYVSPAANAQFDEFEQAIANFDAEVAQGVAEDSSGCVMICIFEGETILWKRAYGWADIENRIAATPETIGRTGSISKSFTAVVIAQLAERGVIDLDEAIANHVPEMSQLLDRPDGDAQVTFRMLASHTSGLEREPRLPDAAQGSIYLWEDKLRESIPATHFNAPLGSRYAYSNIGFGILGYAGGRAAQRSFMELVEQQIFAPLDLSSSTFIVNEPDMIKRLAVGYSRNRDGTTSSDQATKEHFGRGYKVPNGGIYSTVEDLAKFAAAVMGRGPVSILGEEQREELLKPQLTAEGYGLGFVLSQNESMRIAGHGGSVAGYNADLRFDLETGLGIAVLRTTRFNPPSGDFLVRLIEASQRETSSAHAK